MAESEEKLVQTFCAMCGPKMGCDELGLPGYPITNGGANINVMYTVDPEKAFDPLVTAMTKQTLVQVRKAEAEGDIPTAHGRREAI